MENLKIRVNNEAESKEAQELFFELGYEKGACSAGNYPALIIAAIESRYQKTPYSSRATSLNHEAHSQYKEITLPELRDLVVLKRNDAGDANAYCNDNSEHYYISSDGKYFYYLEGYESSKWMHSSNHISYLEKHVKPIEKPMKEYLNKLTDGTYKLVMLSDVIDGHNGLIEIPEWAQVYAVNNGYHYFFSSADIGFEWSVLWQRTAQPEELPFVDDEPSLNDQYAEIEKVRKETQAWANRPVGRCRTVPIDAKPNQTTINAMNEADALIADTLNERQSTYGSFEDVALTTQKIMDAIAWAGGQDKLPAPHHEALHMIASKMARIVNGDHNHKDSWHDIAGYATLVERLL